MRGDVGGLQALAACAAVELVLEQPDLLQVVAQPIVDLTDGRPAGYELLARVPADWQVPPDRLFDAARQLGQGARLQTEVNRLAVDLLGRVPPGCFMTVNLDPTDLAHDDVVAPFLEVDVLRPLVVEVTEKVWPEKQGPADEALDLLRERGALLAVDDVGAGFAGLTQISRLRPEMVKLDQGLVADLGTDPAAELVVEALGRLCGRLDAWVVAEGIERPDQLAVLVRLGVPLGQGYLLGRGERPWPEVHGVDHVLALPPTGDAPGRTEVGGLVLDAGGEPWEQDATGAWLVPGGGGRRAMTMSPSTPVEDALLRAVARPPTDRWAPVLVTDASGRMLGQVGVESMITALVCGPPERAGGGEVTRPCASPPAPRGGPLR